MPATEPGGRRPDAASGNPVEAEVLGFLRAAVSAVVAHGDPRRPAPLDDPATDLTPAQRSLTYHVLSRMLSERADREPGV